jgi:toxin YoeB
MESFYCRAEQDIGMNPSFLDKGWEEYIYWQDNDRKTLRKINKLLADIDRSGESTGIGHPEPLKGDRDGWWSRHIDDKNRLVYRVTGGRIEIAECGSHYGDK